MVVFISISLFLLTFILILPANAVFPRRRLHMLIVHLKGKEYQPRTAHKSLKYKIFDLGEFFYKHLKIKLRNEKYERYKKKLILAGIGSNITVESIVGVKIILSFFVFIYFLLFFLAQGTSLFFVFLIVAPLIGFKLPDSIITTKIRNRQWEMQKELPNILNTLAIITDAGLSLFEAIRKVCEIRKGSLIDELKQVLDEVNMGILQRDALLKMAERCQINEVSVFVFTIVQSLEKGASGVTRVLKEQSEEVWGKRKNKAKELGEKASIKLFLPMLLLVFPCLVIFLLGPAVMQVFKVLVLGR